MAAPEVEGEVPNSEPTPRTRKAPKKKHEAPLPIPVEKRGELKPFHDDLYGICFVCFMCALFSFNPHSKACLVSS